MTVSRFFGVALISLSVLWLLLCGACTLFFVLTGTDPHLGSDVRGIGQGQAFIAIVVGVVGGAIPGVVILLLGLFIRSRDRPAVATPPPAKTGHDA